MNNDLNKHIIPAYLSTVLFKNNLINNKPINKNLIKRNSINNKPTQENSIQENSIRVNRINMNTIKKDTIKKNSIENNTNKKKRLKFYENNIHHYYDYNLIKKLLEKFVSFSDFNELSYKHLNEGEKETYKDQMIKYQNQIIIKTLINIFNNRKIEYENEKVAAKEAAVKKAEEEAKRNAEAKKIIKTVEEEEEDRKKSEEESENMKNHFIRYINKLLTNDIINPNKIPIDYL
jgi:hypothetical protein